MSNENPTIIKIIDIGHSYMNTVLKVLKVFKNFFKVLNFFG